MSARLVAHLPSIFIGFIVAGVGVILMFSWSYRDTPGGAWHWTMIALVVGLMLVYGLVLGIRARTAHGSENDGETFYYLGFIYTLATLVATFAPLLDAAERPDIRHVLGLFGLGLSTTFVGLVGRIVFAQTSVETLANPEDGARRLGDAYIEAAQAIERSTVRIVHAQRRAEGHLNESYSGAIDAIRTLSARVTEQLETMTTQVLNQFSAALERIGTQAESTFAELNTRATRETDGLVAGANGALRTVTDHMVQHFTRIARDSAAELPAFVRQAHGSVAGTLQEAETIVAALGTLRDSLGEANRAWAAVATVTDGATTSIARAGAAFSALESGTRSAEQSIVNWGGGLTKASVALQSVTEIADRAVRLGEDAVKAHVQLSAQISGPLADRLREHGEAAAALVSRLQEDVRASEEAVRKSHHHLIDASRFILSKVEYRR